MSPPPFPERRQTRFSRDQLDQLREAIRDVVIDETRPIKEDVTRIGEGLAKNTELTQEVLETYGTIKSGYKFFGAVGKLALWCAAVLGALLYLWSTLKGKP